MILTFKIYSRVQRNHIINKCNFQFNIVISYYCFIMILYYWWYFSGPQEPFAVRFSCVFDIFGNWDAYVEGTQTTRPSRKIVWNSYRSRSAIFKYYSKNHCSQRRNARSGELSPKDECRTSKTTDNCTIWSSSGMFYFTGSGLKAFYCQFWNWEKNQLIFLPLIVVG